MKKLKQKVFILICVALCIVFRSHLPVKGENDFKSAQNTLASSIAIIDNATDNTLSMNNRTNNNCSKISSEKIEDILLEAGEFQGAPSIEINNNNPFFNESDLSIDFGTEFYSELDDLGRCQYAMAMVGPETLPYEERGEIGHIKPSGWHQNKYPEIINSNPGYLYNRCHLIAYCLTSENDNRNNLITGTRYLNVEGMLPYEILIADYVKSTNNHVLYRVTPCFENTNLLSSGVIIEAKSVEDSSINFCIFCYNVQPGVTIDYATGYNTLSNLSN